MLTTIVSHPQNLKALEDRLKKEPELDQQLFKATFRLQPNSSMPIDEPTGKYRQPDGIVARPSEIRINYKFFSYGPEDLEFLKYAGIITEVRRAVFYVMGAPPGVAEILELTNG